MKDSSGHLSFPSALFSRLLTQFERFLPWLMLALLLRYGYAFFFQIPYLGFIFDVPRGNISEVFVENAALRPGDVLRQVGPVTLAEVARRGEDARFFEGARAGDLIPVRIERQQAVQSVLWRFPGFTWSELEYRLHNQWWLPYVFWLAGTFTMMLIRPRDDRWCLLIAFNYLTAIWLAAGAVSTWKFGDSRVVFRVALWLSVPVALHLHWVFPDPLPRFPRWFRAAGYGLITGIAVAEVFYLLPATAYWYAALLLLGGSALIVLWRLLYRPAQRRELGFLLGAVLLVSLPPIVVALIMLLGQRLPFFVASGSLMALPAIPGAYFYILYRRQLGRRQKRAQRLVWLYLAAITTNVLFVWVLYAATVRLPLDDSSHLGEIALALISGISALLGFAPFFSLATLAGPVREEEPGAGLRLRANRLLIPFFFIGGGLLLLVVGILLLDWLFGRPVVLIGAVLLAFLWGRLAYSLLERVVDRYLLGIRLDPSHLLEGFAQHITTTLDRESLTKLIREEILASLLVRQSLLLHLRENNRTDLILSHGISGEPSCWQRQLPQVALGTGEHPLPEEAPDWVRLVIPLRLNGRTVGCWLWGARDPDDLYRPGEVRMLQALADQTAIALANIVQTENLHALYRTHINGREAERTQLALTLHDEILSDLAILNLHVEEATPPFDEAYIRIGRRLRRTISGLRPAMLNYGLGAAFSELREDLQARAGEETELILDLSPADGRFPLHVEGHLFRIVQQAMENALRHARATKICLEGALAEDGMRLMVVDDGVGFQAGEAFTLTALLAQRHFGLVGMYERAGLVGATVDIASTPGQGTTVTVCWQPPMQPG